MATEAPLEWVDRFGAGQPRKGCDILVQVSARAGLGRAGLERCLRGAAAAAAARAGSRGGRVRGRDTHPGVCVCSPAACGSPRTVSTERLRCLQALEREGVDTLFAYPGGASMEIHQALTRSESIRNILCRHEQVRLLVGADLGLWVAVGVVQSCSACCDSCRPHSPP